VVNELAWPDRREARLTHCFYIGREAAKNFLAYSFVETCRYNLY
jgi:hypothetical protein